jgi:FkbM family methyltransferase
VRLPWGSSVEVNTSEGIGREIFRQQVFDIAVSEAAWRLLKPGDVAVDVGANIGYMTSLFAARVGIGGRVEAFEPHPRIFARLCSNIARNPTPNVRVHEVALGSREGVARLVEPSIFAINEGASTIAGDPATRPSATGRRALEVTMKRLDSVLAGANIELLKLDVEGFEAEVLSGAEQLLSCGSIRHIIYEAHDCSRSPLHGALERFGYSVIGLGHSLFGPRITPGTGVPAVDRSWESPSYLASLEPQRVRSLLRRSGWQVLRGA